MKFKSTSNYIATDELILAVNSSITIERPLLIKGEPGTGKTQLAEELAKHLCLLYTSPSPRDRTRSRMPSSA